MKKGDPVPPSAPAGSGGLDLQDLAEKLGDPDPDFAARTFRHADEAALVEAGTKVDSQNVIDDAARFVGSALSILGALSPAQRALVRLPDAVHPLLVHEAIRLSELKSAHDLQSTGDAADKIKREAELREAMRGGIAERDVVYDSVRNALGDKRLDELNKVVGTADGPAKLAKGLVALADFIDKAAEADAGDAASLEDYGAGPDCSIALRARAKKIRQLGQSTAPSGRRVSQRALDLQDGRVLLLIGKVLRAFRAARRADPTILVPELSRLSRLFETRPRGKGGAADELEEVPVSTAVPDPEAKPPPE